MVRMLRVNEEKPLLSGSAMMEQWELWWWQTSRNLIPSHMPHPRGKRHPNICPLVATGPLEFAYVPGRQDSCYSAAEKVTTLCTNCNAVAWSRNTLDWNKLDEELAITTKGQNNIIMDQLSRLGITTPYHCVPYRCTACKCVYLEDHFPCVQHFALSKLPVQHQWNHQPQLAYSVRCCYRIIEFSMHWHQ